MPTAPTLKQVEHLVQQLPAQEQETLMQHIANQLQTSPAQQANAQSLKEIQAAQIAEAFAIADALAEQVGREFDSVETLRQIREERLNALCG